MEWVMFQQPFPKFKYYLQLVSETFDVNVKWWGVETAEYFEYSFHGDEVEQDLCIWSIGEILNQRDSR